MITCSGQHNSWLDRIPDSVATVIDENKTLNSETKSTGLGYTNQKREALFDTALQARNQCLVVVKRRVIDITDGIYRHHVQERQSRTAPHRPLPRSKQQKACVEDKVLGLLRWANAHRNLPSGVDFIDKAEELNGRADPLRSGAQDRSGSEPSEDQRVKDRKLEDEARVGFGASLMGLVVAKGQVLELDWLLSGLHGISRFVSAAVECQQVADAVCGDLDKKPEVESMTYSLLRFWSEFCLAIFELLRGAMEVWLTLRITPHNCVALQSVLSGGSGDGKRGRAASGGATKHPLAVLDIPTQAIAVCCRLAAMVQKSDQRALPLFVALLDANRIRTNWINVIRERILGAAASSDDTSDSSSDSDSDDGDDEAQPAASQTVGRAVAVSKAWQQDPIASKPSLSRIFVATGSNAGPFCHVSNPQELGSQRSRQSKYVNAKILGEKMMSLDELRCLGSFIRAPVPLCKTLGRALKPPARGKDGAGGKAADAAGAASAPAREAERLISLYDFDGFIHRCMSIDGAVKVWEIEYSEPWVGDAQRQISGARGWELGVAESRSPDRWRKRMQMLDVQVGMILQLLKRCNQPAQVQAGKSTVTSLQLVISSITTVRATPTPQLDGILEALYRELQSMADVCMHLYGTWDETHLWRGVATAEHLQWACVKVAELAACLASCFVPSDARVQFRLPQSPLDPVLAHRLHAAAALFRAARPGAAGAAADMALRTLTETPRAVLSSEQERTLRETCGRALHANAALHRDWKTASLLAQAGDELLRKLQGRWKRHAAARVGALCQERTWLLLQAERDPAVVRAVVHAGRLSGSGGEGHSTAGADMVGGEGEALARADPTDKRVKRWLSALRVESVMLEAARGHMLIAACPVLCVRFHARGKVRPVYIPGCKCVVSWLAGMLAVRDGRCLRQGCHAAVPDGDLKDAPMPETTLKLPQPPGPELPDNPGANIPESSKRSRQEGTQLPATTTSTYTGAWEFRPHGMSHDGPAPSAKTVRRVVEAAPSAATTGSAHAALTDLAIIPEQASGAPQEGGCSDRMEWQASPAETSEVHDDSCLPAGSPSKVRRRTDADALVQEWAPVELEKGHSPFEEPPDSDAILMSFLPSHSLSSPRHSARYSPRVSGSGGPASPVSSVKRILLQALRLTSPHYVPAISEHSTLFDSFTPGILPGAGALSAEGSTWHRSSAGGLAEPANWDAQLPDEQYPSPGVATHSQLGEGPFAGASASSLAAVDLVPLQSAATKFCAHSEPAPPVHAWYPEPWIGGLSQPTESLAMQHSLSATIQPAPSAGSVQRYPPDEAAEALIAFMRDPSVPMPVV